MIFKIPLELGYNFIGGGAGHHWAILLNGQVHEIGKFEIAVSFTMTLTRI